MENKKPLISIITINYNNAEITGDFLESVCYINYDNIEVIVVDNASRENPSEKLKAYIPGGKYYFKQKKSWVCRWK